MLKERVTDLMNRYENGDEWLSAYDVQDELEEIMDDEPWEPLYDELQKAVNDFILSRHEAERGGGRIPDGSDEFIAEIERIVGYDA